MGAHVLLPCSPRHKLGTTIGEDSRASQDWHGTDEPVQFAHRSMSTAAHLFPRWLSKESTLGKMMESDFSHKRGKWSPPKMGSNHFWGHGLVKPDPNPPLKGTFFGWDGSSVTCRENNVARYNLAH